MGLQDLPNLRGIVIGSLEVKVPHCPAVHSNVYWKYDREMFKFLLKFNLVQY